MRSNFCKVKTAERHGFNTVRAKIGKIRCVQSFAKRKQLENMDSTLLELKIEKKDSLNLLQSENS